MIFLDELCNDCHFEFESRLDFVKVEILFQDQVSSLCTMVSDGGVTHSLFGEKNEKGEEGKRKKSKV